MKINVNSNYQHILEEVYEPIILQTEEGNKMYVCMRDDTFELGVIGSDKCYRVDVINGKIELI